MTAKEKAIELRESFFTKCNVTIAGTYTIFRELSKDLAITAVNEVLEVIGELNYMENGGRSDTYGITYWQQVKQEISNL